ncbi:MAG: HAD hydrolase family protein [Dehalococcoidia bacterium]|nr:HAD hydrolase family protein [Dehalococcoidia bacterium]
MTRTDRLLPTDRVTIRFLWLDVDGTLIDGRLSYLELPDGESRTPGPSVARMVSFDSHDGHGLAMLRAVDIAFGFISGNSSEAVRARAEKLGAAECWLGVTNKVVIVRGHQAIALAETAYVGDDLNDVEAMLACGLAFAPASAMPCAKKVAHFVTDLPGGHGAVREVVESLLKWNGACAR